MLEFPSKNTALTSLSDDAIILGFDYGMARIGVAVGNMLTRSSRPLRTITWKVNEQKWNGVAEVIREWMPAAVVVGVPCHADGVPNEMTSRCIRFAHQIEGRFGVPVVQEDERFSSVDVEDSLGKEGVEIDAEAASVILQQWLNRFSNLKV